MSDYIIGFGGLILIGGIMWGVCSTVSSTTPQPQSTTQKLSQQEIDEIREIKANLKPKKEPAPVPTEIECTVKFAILMMFLGGFCALSRS